MVQYWRCFMRGGGLAAAASKNALNCSNLDLIRFCSAGDALRRVCFGFSVESTRGWVEGSWEKFYFRSPVCSSIDESIILCNQCDYCY